MQRSKREKFRRVCSIISGILNVSFLVFLVLSFVYPTQLIFDSLMLGTIILGLLVLVLPYCTEFLKERLHKTTS